jgi:hypothetical protein
MMQKVKLGLTLKIAVVAVFATLLFSTTAKANFIDVGFSKVTNNNVEDLSSQLSLRIWDATQANAEYSSLALSGNQVLFDFQNAVGTTSNIAEIYLDDGTVVSQAAIHNSLGGFTKFTGPGANPGNLPGGNTVSPPFVANALFSADTVSGPPANGINAASDILGVAFNTTGGLAGIQTALALGGATGGLRIGYHIRSIGVADGSDSYVSGPSVPEPTTMLLMGIGMVGLVGAGIRRSRKSNK